MKNNSREVFEFFAIGYVHSPFKDKYGIPRQPSLASQASGLIKLNHDEKLKLALQGLEGFSHIWVSFVFHEHGGKSWKPSIRPPRLGGKEKVGVLASRSPHRPNPIGISVLKLESIDLQAKGGAELHVKGLDLLDGTPVLDIKPYLVYADSFPQAISGWASEEITKLKVHFSDQALAQLLQIVQTSADDTNQSMPQGAHGIGFGGHPQVEFESLKDFVTQVLEIDPRPAYQQKQIPVSSPASWGKTFGLALDNLEIKYELLDGGIVVLSLSLVRA